MSLFPDRNRHRRPKIEIIPMVDVMFLMLVFYILSTIALTVQLGIPVDLPEASTSERSRVEEIVITIDKEGSVFLNRKKISVDNLGPALEETAAKIPGGLEHLQQGAVVLNADLETRHRQVVRVMNELRGVGVTSFAIATEEQQ